MDSGDSHLAMRKYFGFWNSEDSAKAIGYSCATILGPVMRADNCIKSFTKFYFCVIQLVHYLRDEHAGRLVSLCNSFGFSATFKIHMGGVDGVVTSLTNARRSEGRRSR